MGGIVLPNIKFEPVTEFEPDIFNLIELLLKAGLNIYTSPTFVIEPVSINPSDIFKLPVIDCCSAAEPVVINPTVDGDVPLVPELPAAPDVPLEPDEPFIPEPLLEPAAIH